MTDLIESQRMEVFAINHIEKFLLHCIAQPFSVKTLLKGSCRQLTLAAQAALLLFAAHLMAPPAFAQIASGDQPSSVGETTKYVNDGLEVELVRLVQVNDEGEIRLILRIVDTSDPARKIAWIEPSPRLSDDNGNLYVVKVISAVGTCKIGDQPLGISTCLEYAGRAEETVVNSLTALAKASPLTAVIQFIPDQENFLPDLAKASSSFSFVGSLVVLAPDLASGEPFTISIDSIPKP